MDAATHALIVDPDPEEMTAAVSALQGLGCLPYVVSTFDEARECLAGSVDLSLFVTAVRLREFNGIHLALRVRSLFPRAGIVVSDRSFDPVIEREVKKIGARYLLKPIAASSVAEWFTASGAVRGFGGSRRWDRTPLTARIAALVGKRFARLLDVSPGGVRLEVPRDLGERLPAAMRLAIPIARLEIRVRPIWARCLPGESVCECGVELLKADQSSAGRWYDYVDAIARGT